jgi:3-methyladenine DNA glycosylase AlkC
MADVPADVLEALSSGWIETKNLVEWLAVDRIRLAHVFFEELGLGSKLSETFCNALRNQSALKQSFAVGQKLVEFVKPGDDRYQLMCQHASDVVREWCAVVVGFAPDLAFKRRLAWIKTQADDPNAGLREIAWLALRHHVSGSVKSCIECLTPWTGSRSERLRRYASEITRPRGVWTSHIAMLKQSPELAIPILEALRSDNSKYVRDSVGNWLNDASKTQPDWVVEVTNRWRMDSPTLETDSIIKRALRTLNK